MLPVIRSNAYLEDLIAIWGYVARDSEQAADQLVERIESRVSGLAVFPKLGENQPTLGKRTRRVIVGNYLVFYDLCEDRVEVLRVIHAARRIDEL